MWSFGNATILLAVRMPPWMMVAYWMGWIAPLLHLLLLVVELLVVAVVINKNGSVDYGDCHCVTSFWLIARQ
jgi:hypothetical protein